MNNRAEKPAVPTPDAAEVYEHHLSQMSRPMRVAVERYVATLKAENERDEESVGLLCDICDAAFGDPQRAEVHGYAGVLERVRETAERANDYLWLLRELARSTGLDEGVPPARTIREVRRLRTIVTHYGVDTPIGDSESALSDALADRKPDPTPPREAVPAAVGEPWVAKGWEWVAKGGGADHFLYRAGVDTNLSSYAVHLDSKGEWTAFDRLMGHDKYVSGGNADINAAKSDAWKALIVRGWPLDNPADAVPQPDGGASGEAGISEDDMRDMLDAVGADDSLPVDTAAIFIAAKAELTAGAGGNDIANAIASGVAAYHTQLTARLAAMEARR